MNLEFLGVGENRERSVFSNNCTCINFSFLFSTGAAVGAAFTANLGAAAAAAGTAVTSGLGAAASLLSSAAAGASSGGGSPGERLQEALRLAVHLLHLPVVPAAGSARVPSGR
jgi:hypothetical protein